MLLGGLKAGILLDLLDNADPMASGSISQSTTWVLLAGAAALLLVPAFYVGLLGDGLWLALLAVASLAPAPAFARVHVRIDQDGLHVRGLGIRFIHVAIAEVARADVDDATTAAATLHTLADRQHARTDDRTN